MNAINLANAPDSDKDKITDDTKSDNVIEEPISDLESEPNIKRLLSKGKSRVVFHLTSSMAEAQVLLMNEKGDLLVTLSQNNLSTDIKVRACPVYLIDFGLVDLAYVTIFGIT